MIELDRIDDKHFGANYVKIARDVYHRKQLQEGKLIAEACRDNIKVYRQLKQITKDYMIHYLNSKLEEMRIAIKILDRLK